MQISKKDALVLAKILHQHLGPYGLASEASKSEFQDTLEDLSARVDEFLVYGDGEETEDCCDHDCDEGDESDEEAEDDYEDEEDPSDEEDEEDDEGEGEGKESSEEDDGDDSESEELSADSYAGGEELHELKSVKADDGAVEFEHVVDEEGEEDSRVDLLVDGYTEVKDVTHLRRKGKSLHVRDKHDEWTVFYVSRFPKGWSDVLPLDDLVEVEA